MLCGEGNAALEPSVCILVGFPKPYADGGLEASVRHAFLRLTIIPPRIKRHRKPRNQSRFFRGCRAALKVFPRLSDLSKLHGLLYREVVERVAE